MTIEWIIEKLSTDGCNSKKQVVDSLKNANKKELQELKRSIQEEINKKG